MEVCGVEGIVFVGFGVGVLLLDEVDEGVIVYCCLYDCGGVVVVVVVDYLDVCFGYCCVEYVDCLFDDDFFVLVWYEYVLFECIDWFFWIGLVM